MIDELHIKGRGASRQVADRFRQHQYGTVHEEGVDEVEASSNRTRYMVEHARTIVNRVDSPDIPFRWSMNPYQGCEHGCSYCYARPTHEYWGYSAGLDFERVIIVKRNAPLLFEQALLRSSWKGEPITISGATDPYQPIEREEGLTRALLQIALAFGQPVSVITKNALVLRDLDVLSELAGRGLAQVAISLTTADDALRRVMEPRTSTAANRLAAMRRLTDAGVPVHAMIAPIIPALNEPEVPALLEASAEAGALSASYTVLRTNGPVQEVFEDWLRIHFPDRAEKVIAQTRSLHGGRMNDHIVGRRMRGEGVFAQNIKRVFQVMRFRYFADRKAPELVSSLFRRPPKGQLNLFDP